LKKYLLLTIGLLTASGCVAVWQGAHKVKFADENTFVIQYDSSLTSSVRTARLATEHCAKYDRKAVAVDAGMPGVLLGVIEETYDCV
jgi:hypothetical protein